VKTEQGRVPSIGRRFVWSDATALLSIHSRREKLTVHENVYILSSMEPKRTGKKSLRGKEYAAVCACFNLRRASRAVTALYNERLASSGIRTTQLPILVALDQGGPMPLTRLARLLEMDRTTLTRNWLPLERQGLTAESPGEDRRSRVLTITETGRRALAKALPLWEEAQAQFIQAMGEGDFHVLLSKLEAVRRVASRT